MAEAQQSNSPFWCFSLQFYRMPGVAEACIALQDEADVDVNLLLFLLWNASVRRKLSPDDVEGLERQAGTWRDQVVIPLRELRRRLKSAPQLVEKSAAEAFRTRIKQVELEAERLQQEALFELSQSSQLGQSGSDPAEAARDNVAAYQAIMPKAFPASAVDKLLAAFPNLVGSRR